MIIKEAFLYEIIHLNIYSQLGNRMEKHKEYGYPKPIINYVEQKENPLRCIKMICIIH